MDEMYVYWVRWNPETKRIELHYEYTIDCSRLPEMAKKWRREQYEELRKEFEGAAHK